MKKRIFTALVAMVLMLNLVFTVTASASTSVPNQNSEIIQQFTELQNKIDALLTIEDGKYVYDAQEIRSLIESENFDFTALNSEVGTNYTEESFIEFALEQISTTNLNTRNYLRGTYANRNYYTEGWNYRRYFYNNNNSAATADRLDQQATNWGLTGTLGAIASAVPGVGTAISIGVGAGAGISIWYLNTLANSIRVNMSGVGTVTDINKFTFVFTVWDQRNFWE